MILGAQKAGTTALKEYLNAHPQVIGHPHVEFGFFRDIKEFEKGAQQVFEGYFGILKKDTDKKIVAKSAGMYYEEDSIQRLADHNPHCKLVFLIREPVSRAFSAYQMEKFNGWLKEDFEQLIEVIKQNNYDHIMYRLFIKLGMYAEHIKIILNYFPKEQLKIVLYDDFQSKPANVCKEIYTWLDIDPDFVPDLSKRYNESKKAKSEVFTKVITILKKDTNPIKRVLKFMLPGRTFAKVGNTIREMNKSSTKSTGPSSEVLDFLFNYYAPFNKEIETLVDVDLSRWKKNQ